MTDTLATPRAPAALLAELREGLRRPQKELSPKYFYDERGSRLFEEITRLPEYYLTRSERALLERCMPEWIGEMAPRTLVELGAGSAEKTRIVLDPLTRQEAEAVYVPVDVSADFLEDSARRVRAAYPSLRVIPLVADMTAAFALPPGLPGPVLHAFLGSTIGNFDPQGAVALLSRVRERMQPGDALLMGVDLRKDAALIEAAYNDSRGVTAEFNRNMLRALNHATGADFDPQAFAHRAFYEPTLHRIEMHLVARSPQRVHIPGLPVVTLAAGESIRTEISCKHDRASMEAMLAGAGLRLSRWETDPAGLYAILVAEPD
jgi:L-histidine N-alpha-methyltransferase